jgi:hypothetical protein
MTLTNPCGLEGLKRRWDTRLYRAPAPIGLCDAEPGVSPMTTYCSAPINYTVSSVSRVNNYKPCSVLSFQSKTTKQKDIYIYII